MKPFAAVIPGFLALLLAVGAPSPLQAGLFGESEAEKEAKVAKHVADLLREPNRLIAQAQTVAEAGDTEEAIRLFRQAQTRLEEIEMEEDTSSAAFASLRLKKFHCISSLDALALKRAEVQDNRQAVTDTSDLEARLAEERKAIADKAAEAEKVAALARPPTLADQLRDAQQRVMAAEADIAREREALAALEREFDQKATAFTEAAKAHAAADAAAFLASQATLQAKVAAAKGGDPAQVAQAAAAESEAKAAREAAKAALAEAKAAREQVTTRKQVAANRLQAAEGALKDARQGVAVIEQAIAREQAEAEARAKAEKERLEAEALARKQAQAEEIARMRKAQAKVKAEADAKAKAAAEADAQARAHAVAMCNEFWNNKLIDRLEARLTEALGQWPDEPELLLLLARLRLLQGRSDDALELVEAIPASGAVGRKARMVAAGVYLTKNLPMEAMKVLEALMREDPRDPDACFNMAVTMTRLPAIDPKRDLAAKYYARSVQLGGKRSLALEQRLEME